MFHMGGGGAPPETKKVDQTELDKQQSEARAEQKTLAGKRKGIATTRLTDPVAQMTNQTNSAKRRTGLLGGGESGS